MERPTDDALDVEAPNESAPGHDIPEPSRLPDPDGAGDPDAPNESAPGHHPDPEGGE